MFNPILNFLTPKKIARRRANSPIFITNFGTFRPELKNNNQDAKNGFIMYVIMLLVLTVMGTTIALASRTASGLAGITRQSALRAAELAAENGLTITINGMNSPTNRYLWGIPSGQWQNWYYNQDQGSTLYPAADCRVYGYESYDDEAFNLTEQALVFKQIADRTTSDLTKCTGTECYLYQVLAVRLRNLNRQSISDFSQISKTVPSYVEIRVRGIHFSRVNETTGWNSTLNYNYWVGTTDSQAQAIDVSVDITREYVLVPSCCRSGFLYNNQSPSNTYGSQQPINTTTEVTSRQCLYTATSDTTGTEKMGWVIVGPSATGLFRQSLYSSQ